MMDVGWNGLILIIHFSQKLIITMRLSNLIPLRYLFFKIKTTKPTSPTPQRPQLSDLFEFVGETSSQPTSNLTIEKKMYQKNKEIIKNNQKINNYHHFEYFRGEDYIENIPYYDHYKYTEEDQQGEQRDRERVAIEELMPISQHVERAKLIKEKVVGYHDKQRKYEIDQFQRYLSQYPGTVKGPKPEDDMEAFRAYGLKKIPKILLDEIYEANTIQQELIKNKGEVNEEYQQPEAHNLKAPSSFLSYCSKDRQLLQITNENQGQGDDPVKDNFNNDWDQELIEDFKTDIPLIPNMTFENYQHFVNHWMGWLNFRDFHMQHSMKSQLEKLGEILQKVRISLDKDPQNQYIEVESNIPSLYRYYKCLPLQIQNHPGMKDIYLGLEYSSPDFSYEEKEDALNYTCRFLLPFDDISTKVLTDYTKMSRIYPTPYLLDKIFTISPEFTWDLDSFLEEIRNQELKGEISTQNKDIKLPHPPEVHKFWEQGAANLPVDYYENDDGFWDGIISQKLKRYDQHKPMIKTRKYFKH